MNLVHDIEIANKSNRVLTCVFLDVKGAFDHVSIKQMLMVLRKLKLPGALINWVKHFMQSRKIKLIFDNKAGNFQHIESEIPQGSPVSAILFMLYMRHLFPKIRMHYSAKSPSFIDDVAIYVENKSVE